MRIILSFCFLLLARLVISQCDTYKVYESFGSTALPTQGGTWSHNSVSSFTSPVRTGSRAIGFNATGDWIRTPQIQSPGTFSFWYRRSTNTTAWSCVVETSTNGTTWTTRSTLTSATTTYQRHTTDLSGLSNVFVRVRDTRGTGAHERYIDDMSWTSTDATQNTLVPFTTTCTHSVGLPVTVTDNGSYSETYNNGMSVTVTFVPTDPSKLIELNLSTDLENNYDFLYVYDGTSTSDPLLAQITGVNTNLSFVSSSSNSGLTVRFTSDVSITSGGFEGSVSQAFALPVELLYFRGDAVGNGHMLSWATASEKDAQYFEIQESTDGYAFRVIGTIAAVGNTQVQSNYHLLVHMQNHSIKYFRLMQVDIDGVSQTYGPIVLNNDRVSIKIARTFFDLLGREINPDTHIGMYIVVYEDGTIEKRVR